MSTSTSRAEFSAPLALQPPEGPPLNVIAREVAVVSAEGRLQDCRLTFEVTAEQYRAAATRGLFHLAPDNRGPGADTFAPTGTVRIEARLDPGSPAAIELLQSDPDTIPPALPH